MAAVTAAASVVGTTFNTPGGRPASWKILASASMESGVNWAGLITMVHPAASAGPILRVPMARGKFHGVTKMQGPTGWRRVRRREPPSGARA